MDRLRTEKDLDELRRGAHAYGTIAAWSSAGLFRALSDGEPRTAEELPGDPRAIELTAPILAHLGLLGRVGEAWALTADGRALWDSGCLAGRSAGNAFGDLIQLDRLVAHGGPAASEDGSSAETDGGVRDDDRERSRAFLDMLHRRSAGGAEELARRLGPRLSAGAHVLDLGGGHGRYAHALVEAGMRATLFDKPHVVDLARERYGEALDYRGGDFLVDELGGPYDAAVLSNVLHGLGHETNRTLLARVRQALAPGGLLVLKDNFLDEDGAHPEEAAFFGLIMLLFTREGRSYGLRETERLGAELGFERPEHLVASDAGYTLLLMRRPEAEAGR